MRRPLLLAVVVAVLALTLSADAQDHPQVAFTFDDLPAHAPLPPGETRLEVINQILTALKDNKLPPVYGFVNASRVYDTVEGAAVLEAWHKAGEPLGSHTWSHPSLDKTPPELYISNIEKNEETLRKFDPDGDWHWFRYPYLQEGNTLAKRQLVRTWLLDHHYKVAEVTMDFEDYLWNEPYARCMTKQKQGTDEAANLAYLEQSYLDTASQFIDVFRKLSHDLYGRDIPYVLLMHVGGFDAKMLPRLLDLFRSKGFTFTTLPQAEQDPAYSFDPNIGYENGGTLEELVAHVKGVNFPDNTKPYKKLDQMCR